MIIKHICFTGPKKKPAILSFNMGLNVIYGPSNTGKSFVLEAIDFMLGGGDPLRDIKEAVGYDQVYLGIEISNVEYTISRSRAGGDYLYFNGLHTSKPEGIDGHFLRFSNPKKGEISLSDFILSKIGLKNKKLKKNKDNITNNMTLRTILPLSIVDEGDIQKKTPPYLTGHRTTETKEKSMLKLFLTGVDDSSLISKVDAEKKVASKESKLIVLNELIDEQYSRITLLLGEDEDLWDTSGEKEKLEKEIVGIEYELQNAETQLQTIDRNLFNKNNEQKNTVERRNEIIEMLARFDLLLQQYDTDLLRLDSISEAGAIIYALPSKKCPTCGFELEKLKDHDCDEGTIKVTEAANIEKGKIKLLQQELISTVSQLNTEKDTLSESEEQLKIEIQSLKGKADTFIPEVRAKRKGFGELVKDMAILDKASYMLQNHTTLKHKAKKLTPSVTQTIKKEENTDLASSVLDELSIQVKTQLENWKLPNSSRVHFEKADFDFMIEGKLRSSNGKGLRSITHAAASLGLMKQLEDKGSEGIHFVILDSPLLAYEEPEEDETGISQTDVNKHFYDTLANWKTRQVIVFENKKSIPDEMPKEAKIEIFTKNKNIGRYGFLHNS